MVTTTNCGGTMMKKYIVSLIGFLLVPFSSIVYADDGMFGDGGWHMMGGGPLMWILWILVIGVVIYLLVNYSKKQTSDHEETPLDILQKRYAKGEISGEEYEQMKQNLQH
jgi:putative membrane protein